MVCFRIAWKSIVGYGAAQSGEHMVVSDYTWSVGRCWSPTSPMVLGPPAAFAIIRNSPSIFIPRIAALIYGSSCLYCETEVSCQLTSSSLLRTPPKPGVQVKKELYKLE